MSHAPSAPLAASGAAWSASPQAELAAAESGVRRRERGSGVTGPLRLSLSVSQPKNPHRHELNCSYRTQLQILGQYDLSFSWVAIWILNHRGPRVRSPAARYRAGTDQIGIPLLRASGDTSRGTWSTRAGWERACKQARGGAPPPFSCPAHRGAQAAGRLAGLVADAPPRRTAKTNLGCGGEKLRGDGRCAGDGQNS